MAVLLKTASVWVSFIQIMQVRVQNKGKSVWKSRYIGDVSVERKEAGKEYPVQQPVYYISEVLIESKHRYPHWQRLVYGVFMASRKLKQYFQGHPITMVSSAPMGDIIQNREATGRVAKWAIELGPHGLKYMPRTAIIPSACGFHQ